MMPAWKPQSQQASRNVSSTSQKKGRKKAKREEEEFEDDDDDEDDWEDVSPLRTDLCTGWICSSSRIRSLLWRHREAPRVVNLPKKSRTMAIKRRTRRRRRPKQSSRNSSTRTKNGVMTGRPVKNSPDTQAVYACCHVSLADIWKRIITV